MKIVTLVLIVCVTWSNVPIESADLQNKVLHIVTNSNDYPLCSSTLVCLKLTQVMENATDYLVSGTTLMIYPGLHTIDTNVGNILVRDVETLTIRGVGWNDAIQKSSIYCENAFGLTFINITNLIIQNIEMVGCGSEFSTEIRESIDEFAMLCRENSASILQFVPCNPRFDVTASAIIVVRAFVVSVENITISGSKETALVVVNVHAQIILQRVYLANNSINCIISTVYPNDILEELPVARFYQIIDSHFVSGNIIDERRHIASGFNVLLRNSQEYETYVELRNVSAEDNYGYYGNMLFQVEKCLYLQNGLALFNISSVKIKQSKQRTNREGISIETVLPFISFYSSGKRSYLLKFHDTTIVNSGVHVGIHVQYPSVLVDIQFTKLHIAQFAGKYTITMANANVTLTDFKLINSSYLYSLNSRLTIQGTSTIQRNHYGLFFIDSIVIFKGETNITNNAGKVIIMLQKTIIHFQGDSNIQNNTSFNDGCLCAYVNSEIYLTGNVSFIGNNAYNGGAIATYQGSKIFIGNPIYLNNGTTNLVIKNNHANNYGGGIYVDDYYSIHRSQPQSYNEDIPCILYVTKFNLETTSIVIRGNYAEIAGDDLYGGWLKYCYDDEPNYLKVFHLDTRLVPSNINQFKRSRISSSPTRICLCENHNPNCNITIHFTSKFPGERVQIEAIAVGQFLGSTPATVRANSLSKIMKVDKLEHLQSVQTSCTKLNYKFQLAKLENDYMQVVTLTLTVQRKFLPNTFQDTYPNDILFQDLDVLIAVNSCPNGFYFNSSSGICECDQIILEHELLCDTQTGRVKRKPNIWLNDTSVHLNNETESGVIVHNFCPLDYCRKEQQYIYLDVPDEQCQNNRSGMLCGKCYQNLSVVFGSTNCKQCTNYWILLILPLCILAGIILVIFLMTLDLTVSSGAINGLIFYANIVRANQSIFFYQGSTNTFLSWFIAWLNLDIGFEVCFYNGLDTYTKTWLQFVFPMYVWLLVLTIIVSSHYSTRAARLTGNNAVQVLATLFLLSYTKLLRVTIVALSFTTLKYPDGYVQKVWLYDGNVDYLQGKHIALFLAALLVLLFLSIPYTVILVTIQWLQRYTQYTLLKWVTKFLPLFEAYTGPYKIKHRYWPGLLLLVRVLLFLIFSLNIVGDPAINLLAITVTMICILTYSAYLGAVYKSWQLDTLEYSFYVNLGILSAATLYNINSGGNQSQLVFTSTGITFVTFCFIVFYHAYMRLSTTAKGKKIITCITLKIKGPKQKMDDKDEDKTDSQSTSVSLPTRSIVELHEPLLDT